MAAADRVNSTPQAAVQPQEAACTTTLKVIALIATLAIGAGLLMHFMRWTSFTAAVVTGSTGAAVLALSLLGCCYNKSDAAGSSSSASASSSRVAAVTLPGHHLDRDAQIVLKYVKEIVEAGTDWQANSGRSGEAGFALMALRARTKWINEFDQISTLLGQQKDVPLRTRRAIQANLEAFLKTNEFQPSQPPILGESQIKLFRRDVASLAHKPVRCADGEAFYQYVQNVIKGVSSIPPLIQFGSLSELSADAVDTTLEDVLLLLEEIPQTADTQTLRSRINRQLQDFFATAQTPRPNITFSMAKQRLLDFLKTFAAEVKPAGSDEKKEEKPSKLEGFFATMLERDLTATEKAEAIVEFKNLATAPDTDKTLETISTRLYRYRKTDTNFLARQVIHARLVEIFYCDTANGRSFEDSNGSTHFKSMVAGVKRQLTIFGQA